MKSTAEQVIDFAYSLRDDGFYSRPRDSEIAAFGGMYRVMYWDAHGDAHVTEKMDKAKAETARDSMSPSQEARLVFVK